MSVSWSVGQSVLKLVRFSSGSCGSWVGNFRFGLGLHSDKSFGKTTHKVLIKEVLLSNHIIGYRKQKHSGVYRVAAVTKNIQFPLRLS